MLYALTSLFLRGTEKRVLKVVSLSLGLKTGNLLISRVASASRSSLQ